MQEEGGFLPTLESFRGRRVLMLQGPMGPFFRYLAHDLRQRGAAVFKINFNGGDWIYFRDADCNYGGSLTAWPSFLENFVISNRIDTVLLYGDCRPVHRPVYDLRERYGLAVYAFEEGYIRPDYVTLERDHVNARSTIPRSALFYRNLDISPVPEARSVGYSFGHLARHAVTYHAAAWVGSDVLGIFGNTYHRRYGLSELWPQIISGLRKVWYDATQKRLEERLLSGDPPFFLVPLQVAGDSQVKYHSEYGRVGRNGIELFITEVVESFARRAPAGVHLVFKHHPLDRGYNHYGRLLRRLGRRHGLSRRIHYLVRNGNLPALLDRAQGVVVVNSTVGLQAIDHGRPVKAMGRTVYDIPGLTAQIGLDEFWTRAGEFIPDRELYRKFRAYLITRTQINGNFHRPLSDSVLRCGLAWPDGDAALAGGRNVSGRENASPDHVAPLRKTGSGWPPA